MAVSEKGFQELLSEWLDAKDETDKLFRKYVAIEKGDISDSSAPTPERPLDTEGVWLIALAKRKEEECKNAFLEVARKETGRVQ